LFTTLSLDHSLYTNDTNEGTQESKKSEANSPVPCNHTSNSELDEDRERSKKSNILVGGRHDDWNHVVLKEEWSKNHTSGNTCHTTKDGGEHASKSHFDNITSLVESHIFLIPVVMVFVFNLVNVIDNRDSISGGKTGNDNVYSEYKRIHPPWVLWIFNYHLSNE